MKTNNDQDSRMTHKAENLKPKILLTTFRSQK